MAREGAGARPAGPAVDRAAVTAVAEDEDAYRASFERFAARTAATEPVVAARPAHRRLRALRRDAACPTPRDEAWRHTPIAPLVRTRFEPADPAARRERGARGRAALDGFRGPQAVFVNGGFAAELSRRSSGCPAASRCWSLREVLQATPGGSSRTSAAWPTPRPASSPTSTPPSPRTARVVFARPGRGRRRSPFTSSTSPAAGRGRRRRVRAHARRGRPRQRGPRRRELRRRPTAGAYLVERRDRGAWSRTTPAWTTTSCSRRARPRFHVATPRRRGSAATPASPTTRSRSAPRSPASTSTSRFAAEGGECVLERPLRRSTASACTDTHSRIDHARPHCTSRRALQGRPRRPGAAASSTGSWWCAPGAQKTDAVADEPEPAALAGGARRTRRRSSRSWPTT